MLVGFVSVLLVYLAMTNSTLEKELPFKFCENECHVVIYILAIDVISVTNVISAMYMAHSHPK
jgi:hypothetical protein